MWGPTVNVVYFSALPAPSDRRSFQCFRRVFGVFRGAFFHGNSLRMERQDSKKTRNIPSRSPSPSSEDAKQRSSALSRLLFSEESPFVRRTEVSKWSAVVFVLVFTLFLRYLISVHSYSGKGINWITSELIAVRNELPTYVRRL